MKIKRTTPITVLATALACVVLHCPPTARAQENAPRDRTVVVVHDDHESRDRAEAEKKERERQEQAERERKAQEERERAKHHDDKDHDDRDHADKDHPNPERS